MRGMCALNRFLAILVLMAGITASLAAQTATTGALTGTVSDPTGALIPGVEVTAMNTETALDVLSLQMRTVFTGYRCFH